MFLKIRNNISKNRILKIIDFVDLSACVISGFTVVHHQSPLCKDTSQLCCILFIRFSLTGCFIKLTSRFRFHHDLLQYVLGTSDIVNHHRLEFVYNLYKTCTIHIESIALSNRITRLNIFSVDYISWFIEKGFDFFSSHV